MHIVPVKRPEPNLVNILSVKYEREVSVDGSCEAQSDICRECYFG